jgi:hypothetical protein
VHESGKRQRARRLRRSRVAAAVVLVALGAGGCAGPSPDGAGRNAPTASVSRSVVGPSDADLWLSFEKRTVDYDGTRAYPDALGGPFVARVVTANQGKVEEAPGADGSLVSVGFPARCVARSGCPRAMLEVPTSPALDPGEETFEYGATVWLAPDQTATGSNVLQKGRFDTTGGQWKLQVDSEAGEPSCVVRSGTTLLVVRSRASVSDSAWHHVVCRRDEDGISIRVDDTVDRAQGHTGSVSNTWPVRVGSPGVGDQDDQFHGRVDDVFLRIGS